MTGEPHEAVGAQALKQSAHRSSPSVLVLLSPIVPFLSPNPPVWSVYSGQAPLQTPDKSDGVG
jgi:hypothetical protein